MYTLVSSRDYSNSTGFRKDSVMLSNDQFKYFKDSQCVWFGSIRSVLYVITSKINTGNTRSPLKFDT